NGCFPPACPPSCSGYSDAFVTELTQAGDALEYSTFLGGRFTDDGFGIAVDAAGNAYVAGETTSADFPVTSGALQSINRVNGDGDTFGHTSPGAGIAVDAAGSAYVTGATFSTDIPATPTPRSTTAPTAVQSINAGNVDAFVPKITMCVAPRASRSPTGTVPVG